MLHDIGKLRELDYHPVEAKYTKEGCLIGHVLMGRDMVREAARHDRRVPGGDAAPPGARDPRAPRQARVRRPDPAPDARGHPRLVHRRSRRQDEHRGTATDAARRPTTTSPTGSSRSTTAGSTRASLKSSPTSPTSPHRAEFASRDPVPVTTVVRPWSNPAQPPASGVSPSPTSPPRPPNKTWRRAWSVVKMCFVTPSPCDRRAYGRVIGPCSL